MGTHFLLAVELYIRSRYPIPAKYNQSLYNISQLTDITTPPHLRQHYNSLSLNSLPRHIILRTDVRNKVISVS